MSVDKSEYARENWETLRRATEILSEQFENFGDIYHGALYQAECSELPKAARRKYKNAAAETQRASNTALALATALEGYLVLTAEAGVLLRKAMDAGKKEGGK